MAEQKYKVNLQRSKSFRFVGAGSGEVGGLLRIHLAMQGLGCQAQDLDFTSQEIVVEEF